MRTRMTKGIHLRCKFLFISSDHLDGSTEEYKYPDLLQKSVVIYVNKILVMNKGMTADAPII